MTWRSERTPSPLIRLILVLQRQAALLRYYGPALLLLLAARCNLVPVFGSFDCRSDRLTVSDASDMRPGAATPANELWKRRFS
jgi:hypothetical protein